MPADNSVLSLESSRWARPFACSFQDSQCFSRSRFFALCSVEQVIRCLLIRTDRVVSSSLFLHSNDCTSRLLSAAARRYLQRSAPIRPPPPRRLPASASPWASSMVLLFRPLRPRSPDDVDQCPRAPFRTPRVDRRSQLHERRPAISNGVLPSYTMTDSQINPLEPGVTLGLFSLLHVKLCSWVLSTLVSCSFDCCHPPIHQSPISQML